MYREKEAKINVPVPGEVDSRIFCAHMDNSQPVKISILLPKTQVLQYLTNYVRILDQADNLILKPHRGQVKGSTSQTLLISSLRVFDGTCGGS
jgi:hypothetical protein